MKSNKNLLVLAAFIVTSMSSCMNFHKAKGDEYYAYLNYAPAIKHFEKVYAKKQEAETELKLADAYFQTNQLDSAEAKYARAITRGNIDPKINMNYGKVLMAQGKKEESTIQFEKYLQFYPGDAVVKNLNTSFSSDFDRYKDTALYTLEPIIEDQFMNTFSIIEYKDGAVFSADKKVSGKKNMNPWTGDSYLDLYQMNKDKNGNWSEAELLKGDVNGRLHEGTATFSNDGNTMYFTRSNYIKNKMVVNEEDENNLKIFKANLIHGEWKDVEEFPFNSDDYSCGHPSLSEDGRTMYFTSDMPGGLGGADLYKTTLNGENQWTTPQNLGSQINTAGDEVFPYIHHDGYLYFSSNAHNSMGGLDIFETTQKENEWTKPENLNHPINSTKDDFAFSLNKSGQAGFISSSRSKSDVMYSFVKNEIIVNLFVKVREKEMQKPLEGVVIDITNTTTGVVISLMSNQDGSFNVSLNTESCYELLCTNFGCFSETDLIDTRGLRHSEDFYAIFEVEPIAIDQAIVIKDIYYDFNKWNIRADATIELDKLVRILVNNPNIDIEIGSHTDARGSDNYNMTLSNKRAKSVVSYLIKNGIDPNRLTHKGYGETVHVNECKNGVQCAEEYHQQNRRTEFKIKKVNN